MENTRNLAQDLQDRWLRSFFLTTDTGNSLQESVPHCGKAPEVKLSANFPQFCNS
jgi:hypothetical protein